MKYELELLVNNDEDYNALFYFDDSDEMMMFIDMVLSHGYEVKVRGVKEDE